MREHDRSKCRDRKWIIARWVIAYMNRKTNAAEPCRCACGTSLRDEDKSAPEWEVYPNPAVCTKCGMDNSAKVKLHIVSKSVAATRRPLKQSRKTTERKLREFAGRYILQNGNLGPGIQ